MSAERLEEIVHTLSSRLESIAGEEGPESSATGDAMSWAADAVGALGEDTARGGLLGQVGLAAANLGEALEAVDELGCSGSDQSLGAQLGLADALSYTGRVLATVTSSMDAAKVPEEHVGAAKELRDRMDDLAFRFTLAGADLHAVAGGVQPLAVAHGPTPDPCPCCPDDGDPATAETSLVVHEPDFEAASKAVRCVGPLVRDHRVLMGETISFMAPLLLAFSCATGCRPCNAVLAGPAPGGLTVANNGAGIWAATQVVNWTLCCCDWCWLLFTDHWRTPKTTTLTWNTGVPWTRPAGAALRVARRTAPRRVAGAPPPTC
jgi:hypothetical protein